MLSDALRNLLLHGPGRPPSHANFVRYGGTATIRAAWARHRQELIDLCEPGRRPWAYWMLELVLKQRPTEAGELRLIRQLELDRDERERAYVVRRLAEIVQAMRAGRSQSSKATERQAPPYEP